MTIPFIGKGYQPQPSASADTPVPRPWLFWISQKPHPIIVYNNGDDDDYDDNHHDNGVTKWRYDDGDDCFVYQ